MGKNAVSRKIEELESVLPQGAPLGTAFRTKKNGYYYDAPTGKVLVCLNNEFRVVEAVLSGKTRELPQMFKRQGKVFSEACDSVIKAVKNEHVLSCSRFERMDKIEGVNRPQDIGLEQLILELTERCNLRCVYCTFNEGCDLDRNFGTRDMAEELAFAAIDYAAALSVNNEKLSITFYGGEPLLRFDLLKKCVLYAVGRAANYELHFSFTTNATLVTPDIAAWLASVKNMSLLVSLDGPLHIHYFYRKNETGGGSFNQTVSGLRLLAEAFGERAKEAIAINAVYAPPFAEEKIEDIKAFFNSLEWLPQEVAVNAAYPRDETMPLIEKYLEKAPRGGNGPRIDMSLSEWASRNYNTKGAFLTRIPNEQFLRLYSRVVTNEPKLQIWQNGCCVPGRRRLYVCVNGDFRVCERIGQSPSLGNIKNGLDAAKVEKIYISDYAEKSFEDCAVCWLGRLCDTCYATCFCKNGLDMEKKRKYCEKTRLSWQKILCAYFEMLEDDPHVFDALANVKKT